MLCLGNNTYVEKKETVHIKPIIVVCSRLRICFYSDFLVQTDQHNWRFTVYHYLLHNNTDLKFNPAFQRNHIL